jgi:FKBP-type peptidyl-prolyl cis-trans isomerase SlyD
MQFDGLPEGAVSPDMPADLVYTVTEIYPGHVVLDANHPLAGVALRIALKVCDVRPASAEEVAANSVGAAAVQVLSGAPPDEPLH